MLGLRNVRHPEKPPVAASEGVVGGSLSQLRNTFAKLKHYPHTMTFLLAYLFFNDGIQTVIVSASLYGKEELGFGDSQLIVTILLVQFVAFGGALLFGRLAARYGAKNSVLGSLMLWVLVVVIAFFLPSHQFGLWLALSVGIGIVLGGSQALSRSLYSRLVPIGRESEYFSLYQAMERGTSWFGALAFGLVHQWTGSYRLSIIALLLFFVLGGVLLKRVDVEEGARMAAAGSVSPAVASAG